MSQMIISQKSDQDFTAGLKGAAKVVGLLVARGLRSLIAIEPQAPVTDQTGVVGFNRLPLTMFRQSASLFKAVVDHAAHTACLFLASRLELMCSNSPPALPIDSVGSTALGTDHPTIDHDKALFLQIVGYVRSGDRLYTEFKKYQPESFVLHESISYESIIRSLIEHYNAFKETNPDTPPLDLSGLVLIDMNLSSLNFERVNLRGTHIQRCNLSNSNFSHADMSRILMSEVDLSGSDLSGATLRQATFSHETLYHINAYGEYPVVNTVRLTNTNFNGADLMGASLQHADFTASSVEGTRFRQANLTGSNLSGKDLSSLDFNGALLERAQMARAIMRETQFNGAVLYRAVLNDANMAGAQLCDACLERVYARGTIFANSSLRGAVIGGHLNEAVFSGADLTEATVRGDASGADFSLATLNRTTFDHCNLTKATLKDTTLAIVCRDTTFNCTDMRDSHIQLMAVQRSLSQGSSLKIGYMLMTLSPRLLQSTRSLDYDTIVFDLSSKNPKPDLSSITLGHHIRVTPRLFQYLIDTKHPGLSTVRLVLDPTLVGAAEFHPDLNKRVGPIPTSVSTAQFDLVTFTDDQLANLKHQPALLISVMRYYHFYSPAVQPALMMSVMQDYHSYPPAVQDQIKNQCGHGKLWDILHQTFDQNGAALDQMVDQNGAVQTAGPLPHSIAVKLGCCYVVRDDDGKISLPVGYVGKQNSPSHLMSHHMYGLITQDGSEHEQWQASLSMTLLMTIVNRCQSLSKQQCERVLAQIQASVDEAVKPLQEMISLLEVVPNAPNPRRW